MAKGTVPKRELTSWERDAAVKLKAAWEAYAMQEPNKGATQAWLGQETELGTQGLIGQYLNGQIPLNHKALFAICQVINVDPSTISPELSATLPANRSISADPAQHTVLVYVDHEELKILTAYREASHLGQKHILSAAINSEKK